MPTGTPDFSRTPLVQTDAATVTLLGSATFAAPNVAVTFGVTDKTTIVAMVANMGWFSPTGPYIWPITFRFTGNIAGTFDVVTGISIPAAGTVANQAFTLPLAVPARLASMLGTNVNTTVTLTCRTQLPDGQLVVGCTLVVAS